MTDPEIDRVCSALAGILGLGTIQPRVIGRFSNIAVALEPLPLVARIATGTALIRDTLAFAEREVAITAFLASRGAPVIAPCAAPLAGPHSVEGWTVTLWRQAGVLAGLPDPRLAGQRLAECHRLLRDYPDPPPRSGALEELNRLIAHPQVCRVIDSEDLDWMADRCDRLRLALEPFQQRSQALHGDAHRKNVLRTADGPLWTDWEDTITAPVEWDLACLVTGARINSLEVEWAEAALVSYGQHDAAALALCIEARALFGIGWLALLSRENPDRLQRLARWKKWLRAR